MDTGTALVKHYSSFLKLAKKLLQNEEDAKDIVQDAVLACLELRHVKNPVHYCMRTVRNRCFSLLRNQVTLTPYEVSETWNQTTREYFRRVSLEEKLERLELLKEKLNPHDRLVLELYYGDKKTLEEVAQLTGRSKATISRIVSRTKAILKSGLISD